MLKGGSQGFGTDSSILLVFVQAAITAELGGWPKGKKRKVHPSGG